MLVDGIKIAKLLEYLHKIVNIKSENVTLFILTCDFEDGE